MRKIFALCIIALFFNCTTKSEHNKIVYTRMVIKYVDLDILTPIDVDCNNFESFFNDEIKVKIITDTLLINEFVTELNRLPSDSITPDTRITVILSGNSLNERRLCIDKFNTLDGNNNYSSSENILKIIDKLLAN